MSSIPTLQETKAAVAQYAVETVLSPRVEYYRDPSGSLHADLILGESVGRGLHFVVLELVGGQKAINRFNVLRAHPEAGPGRLHVLESPCVASGLRTQLDQRMIQPPGDFLYFFLDDVARPDCDLGDGVVFRASGRAPIPPAVYGIPGDPLAVPAPLRWAGASAWTPDEGGTSLSCTLVEKLEDGSERRTERRAPMTPKFNRPRLISVAAPWLLKAIQEHAAPVQGAEVVKRGKRVES